MTTSETIAIALARLLALPEALAGIDARLARLEASLNKARPPSLASYKDAAKALGVHYSTICRLVKAGKLSVVRVGGRPRVDLSVLRPAAEEEVSATIHALRQAGSD